MRLCLLFPDCSAIPGRPGTRTVCARGFCLHCCRQQLLSRSSQAQLTVTYGVEWSFIENGQLLGLSTNTPVSIFGTLTCTDNSGKKKASSCQAVGVNVTLTVDSGPGQVSKDGSEWTQPKGDTPALLGSAGGGSAHPPSKAVKQPNKGVNLPSKAVTCDAGEYCSADLTTYALGGFQGSIYSAVAGSTTFTASAVIDGQTIDFSNSRFTAVFADGPPGPQYGVDYGQLGTPYAVQISPLEQSNGFTQKISGVLICPDESIGRTPAKVPGCQVGGATVTIAVGSGPGQVADSRFGFWPEQDRNGKTPTLLSSAGADQAHQPTKGTPVPHKAVQQPTWQGSQLCRRAALLRGRDNQHPWRVQFLDIELRCGTNHIRCYCYRSPCR